MPKIQWTHLPPALRDHLFDRLRERKITVEDLYHLKLWRESEPEAPDGLWWKDFGSFKVCGEGRSPHTESEQDHLERAAHQELPELSLDELRQAGPLAGLHRRGQEGLEVLGDDLMEQSVLGVARSIRRLCTCHPSGSRARSGAPLPIDGYASSRAPGVTDVATRVTGKALRRGTAG